MIKKFRLVETIDANKKQLNLHPKILTILFEHRRDIKNIFLQIKGLYEISHIGITIINPANEIVVFSSTPSIEYNLINQNLWQHDDCFSLSTHNKIVGWWDLDGATNNIERIKKIKLNDNNYSHGMTISRRTNNFCFLYSFATRSKRNNLRKYYECSVFSLIRLGDYFYKEVRDIYSAYCISYIPPEINCLTSTVAEISIQPNLKLVVNNHLILE